MAALDGRRIIITGAGSGIGRAVAQRFAEEGATLALFDLKVDALSDFCERFDAKAFSVDVSQESVVVESVTAAVDFLGGIDGLVNAGKNR